MSVRPLVIGVGNAFRQDDAAGLMAARRLAEESLPGVTVLEQSGEGAALMDCWEGAGTVILVDAVQAGGSPGAVYRFEAGKEPMPTRFFNYSTHAFSVAEAIELARLLGRLPERLIVYGIEGQRFGAGQETSPAVMRAVDEVVGRVLVELGPEG